MNVESPGWGPFSSPLFGGSWFFFVLLLAPPPRPSGIVGLIGLLALLNRHGKKDLAKLCVDG